MRHGRMLLLLVGVVALCAPASQAAEVLGNGAILSMVKAGLGEDLIVTKVKTSPGQYDLSTDAIIALKKSGVSERIIQAMLTAQGPDAGAKDAAAPAPGPDTAQLEQEAVGLYRQGKPVEALARFDRLIAEKPSDDGPRIWKALALLDQARALQEAKGRDYKPLVLGAYGILQPMGKRQAGNADWLYGMAKAFWLNERPERARRVAERAVTAQANHHESRLLLADMVYEEAVNPPPSAPRDETAKWRDAARARQAYEQVLAAPDVPPALQAEALYRIGIVWQTLERRPADARATWERAVAAAPESRYGLLAQEKLKAAN